MSLEEIVLKLDTGASERAAAAIAEGRVRRAVVGGGADRRGGSGLCTARKEHQDRRGRRALRRAGARRGDPRTSSRCRTPRSKLAAAPSAASQTTRSMNLQRATGLVPAATQALPITVKLASGAALKAESMILTTGALARGMGVPGEGEYKARALLLLPALRRSRCSG